jgi:hypothetical protein
LTNECGRSSGHEPNPGWSFRIPASWEDDTEGTSYRYWKFIMNTFHGTDNYGGIMELELYEASDALDDEVSSSSIVAQDVYAETGNFNRGVAIGKGYGGTSTGENNLLVQGYVGIGTTSPTQALDIVGAINLTGKITTPYFKVFSIFSKEPANGWTKAYAGTIKADSTVVIICNTSGYASTTGSYTWTLQYSTNNGSTYTTLDTFNQYFNTTSDHEEQSRVRTWQPSSDVNFTHWRISFNGNEDQGDYTDLVLIVLPV